MFYLTYASNTSSLGFVSEPFLTPHVEGILWLPPTKCPEERNLSASEGAEAQSPAGLNKRPGACAPYDTYHLLILGKGSAYWIISWWVVTPVYPKLNSKGI